MDNLKLEEMLSQQHSLEVGEEPPPRHAAIQPDILQDIKIRRAVIQILRSKFWITFFVLTSVEVEAIILCKCDCSVGFSGLPHQAEVQISVAAAAHLV